jgi:hypothetical protein
LSHVFATIGDGIMWRRATDPSFDGPTVFPVLVGILTDMLKPVHAAHPSLPSSTTSLVAQVALADRAAGPAISEVLS